MVVLQYDLEKCSVMEFNGSGQSKLLNTKWASRGNNNDLISTDNEDEKFLNSDRVVSIVNLLQKFKVKLWEMASIENHDADKDHLAEDLIMKLSDESGLIENEVKTILIKLQQHSMNKFENNRRYRTDGIACFKLKIIGNYNKSFPRSFNQNIEISIGSTGNELKEFIINDLKLDCSNLKIICNGKVIREDMLLSSQNIKNHSTLLVMCIYDKKLSELAKNTADQKLISDIKDAVSFLNEEKLKLTETSFKAEFKVKNQNGISLDISAADTNSLTIAMILHEKAKTSINSKDYLKALILLAEADNEFKNCQDISLLERVDNYALLNLDIIWCYLNLENLHELKNAEERLDSCEKCLVKCYGADLERLTMLKNESASKHIPIFVRLNLFKSWEDEKNILIFYKTTFGICGIWVESKEVSKEAILSYHKGKKAECKQLLDIASKKMQKITIDEEKLVQIMAMGFTSIEARLALRAAFNDVDSAMDQILKKKQREKESKQVELARSLEKEFGKTATNKPIDIKLLENLKHCGYSKTQVAQALIVTDNDFDAALNILSSNSLDAIVRDDNLEKLIAMGYSVDLSEMCLNAFDNNILQAIEFFTKNKDVYDLKSMLEHKCKEVEKSSSEERPSTSRESEEKAQNALRIYEDLAEEINKDDEAYLDFNLNEDTFYIDKYYSMLKQ